MHGSRVTRGKLNLYTRLTPYEGLRRAEGSGLLRRDSGMGSRPTRTYQVSAPYHFLHSSHNFMANSPGLLFQFETLYDVNYFDNKRTYIINSAYHLIPQLARAGNYYYGFQNLGNSSSHFRSKALSLWAQSPRETIHSLWHVDSDFSLFFLSFFLSSSFLLLINCLLYTSPSPRDRTRSRMPSSA